MRLRVWSRKSSARRKSSSARGEPSWKLAGLDMVAMPQPPPPLIASTIAPPAVFTQANVDAASAGLIGQYEDEHTKTL